jgi:flagellar motor component MotA/polyhydroxyalkanoate synthesis regulator phasin
MQLMAEPQMAGRMVNCPGCNTKFPVPAFMAPAPTAEGGPGWDSADGSPQRPVRNVWKEEDPTNPNALKSVAIGMGITVIWFAIIYFFQAPEGTPVSQYTTGQTLANLFYKHFTVSFINTLFFFWGAAICYLKFLKLKHQRQAMLLDVLPMDLGSTIDARNVGVFIDHVYSLPEVLRDSLMVNRIRKALEFFEVRQNVADVSTLMSSQSAIDGSRIMGSYILVRAFLWAIPLLGFIGTVVGLSHAISGMSFSNVEDVSKIVGSINNVTSGLGTAFDATLLGLVFAVLLNFPLNSLAKHEEEALNDIDAFCNEVLLPRLDDGAAAEKTKDETSDLPAVNDLRAVAEIIVQTITASQKDFLTDLNTLSGRMLDYANNLESRNEQYQQAVIQHMSERLAAIDAHAQEHMTMLRDQHEKAMGAFSENLTQLTTSSKEASAAMVREQNTVLSEFSQKIGGLSAGIDSALSSASQATQRAVASFGEHVTALENRSKEYQGTLQKSQEDTVQSFSEKLSRISSNLETAVSDKLKNVFSGVESNLNASVEATQKAVGSFAGFVSKLDASAQAQQQSLMSAQEESLKRIGQAVQTVAAGLESSIAERLKNVFSGVESTLNASVESTHKAVGSFAGFVSKLDASAQAQQQTLVSAQEESLKRIGQTVQTVATGLESSIAERLKAVLSGMESTLGNAAQSTQKAVSAFGEHLTSLESNTKGYQQAVRTAQGDVLKQFGTQINALAANTENSISDKLRGIFSGMESALGASLQATQRAVSSFAEQVSRLESAAAQQQQFTQQSQAQANQQFAERINALTSGLETSLQKSVQTTQQTLAGLETGIRHLNTVLEQLGSKQVVIQQAPKKGWFGRG